MAIPKPIPPAPNRAYHAKAYKSNTDVKTDPVAKRHDKIRDQYARLEEKYTDKLLNKIGDRWWRLNNLYMIVSDKAKQVIFRPAHRPVQTYLYNNLHQRMVILKSRQHGITTFFCMLFLDICLTTPNTHAGIIAHTIDDAKRFLRDKIKYAYNHIRLPHIKEQIKITRSNSQELQFSNGSTISVGLSLRSTTLSLLHISEYGKISSMDREKAVEVKTGAIPTVPAISDSLITVESTAEGATGEFFDMYDRAEKHLQSGEPFTILDFKPYFFGWHEKPECVLEQRITIPQEHIEYFNELQNKHNIELTPEQQGWYVKTYAIQQDRMLQEYPTTAEEAFRSSTIGAFYRIQMERLRVERRHLNVVYDPNLYTNVAFDLGMGDAMSLVFYQTVGDWVVFVDYYECSGVDFPHYIDIIKSRPYKYNKLFVPHDAAKRDIVTGRSLVERAARDYGVTLDILPQSQDFMDDINFVRSLFHRVKIDSQKCGRLIECLDKYKKKFDKHNGVFFDKANHDEYCHGSDAFRYALLSLDYLTTFKKDFKINVIPSYSF